MSLEEEGYESGSCCSEAVTHPLVITVIFILADYLAMLHTELHYFL